MGVIQSVPAEPDQALYDVGSDAGMLVAFSDDVVGRVTDLMSPQTWGALRWSIPTAASWSASSRASTAGG